MGAARLSVRQRLLTNRRIDPITNCWLWTGHVDKRGRAVIGIKYRTVKVSRAAYEEFVGPIKNQVNHKRECPNKHCFNPEHLYDGTQSDNRVDEVMLHNVKGKGRGKGFHCDS